MATSGFRLDYHTRPNIHLTSLEIYQNTSYEVFPEIEDNFMYRSTYLSLICGSGFLNSSIVLDKIPTAFLAFTQRVIR
jgi:hypothetical protein